MRHPSFPDLRKLLALLALSVSLTASPALAAFQFSDAARNAAADAIETAIGASPILEIRSGTKPANCATAPADGAVLASMTLPADWLAAAASGSKTLLGTWSDSSADATGTATYFRIMNSAGTTCHILGTVGMGTGDVQLQNTSIATGQAISITAFTITQGGG